MHSFRHKQWLFSPYWIRTLLNVMFEGIGANQSTIASTTRIFISLFGNFSNKFQLALNFTINSTKSFTNLPEFFRSVSFPNFEGTKQQNMVIMQCNRRMQVKGEGKKSTLIVHLIRSSLISIENSMILLVNRKTRLKIIAKNCQGTRKGTPRNSKSLLCESLKC